MGKKNKKAAVEPVKFIEADPGEVQEEVDEAGEAVPESAMGKKMASADKKIRDKAISVMTKWISQQRALDEDEHLKLWKSLYYCYWMSDKGPVQQDLADKLAKLVHSFPVLPQSLLFLRAFFMTMQREWPGIDRYRLDKFYNLVRCVQNEAFSLLKKNGWRAKDITTYNNLMAGSAGPLRASCPIVGLQLHVVEILLDELSDSMTSGITPEQFTHILSPYLQLLKQSRDPAVIARIIKMLENLAGDKWLAASLVEEEDEHAAELAKQPIRHNNRMFKHTYVPPVPVPDAQDACKDGGFAGQCAHAVTRRIFRVTVNPQTTEASRRKLYDLLETFKGVCEELNRPFTEDPDDVSDDDEGATAASGDGKKGVAADVGKAGDSVGKKRRLPPVDADEGEGLEDDGDEEDEEEEDDDDDDDEQVSEPPSKKQLKGSTGAKATPGKSAKENAKAVTPSSKKGTPSSKKGTPSLKKGTQEKERLVSERAEKMEGGSASGKKRSVEERKMLRKSVESVANASNVLSSDATVSPRKHAATAADFFMAEVSDKSKKGLDLGAEKTPSKKGEKASTNTPGNPGKEGKGAPKTPKTPVQIAKKRSPKPRSAKGK